MQTVKTTIESFPGTARVWVYMADRSLTAGEAAELGRMAAAFAASWAAHGKGLSAHAEVRYDRFLILVVDEENHAASGCSIDSSVQFIRDAGKAIGADFFNRLLVGYKNSEGRVEALQISEFRKQLSEGKITPDTIVFNNLVDTRTALETGWELPVHAGPYSRLLTV